MCDRDWPFGVVAQSDAGNIEIRSLLLYPTGVRQDKTAVRDQTHEIGVSERLSEP